MKNNCKKYEKWLYLHREGELTNRQAVKLAKHLQSCSECSKVSRQLEQLHQDIVQVNKYNELDNFQLNITGSILNSIRIMQRDKSYLSLSLFDRILFIFTKPAVQVASIALVLFMCLTLVFQETSAMLRIAGLEKRMAHYTERSNKMDRLPEYSRTFYQRINNSEILTGFTGTKTNEQYIVIDKKIVESFLNNYQQTRIQNEILLQVLQLEYPELLELMSKDSLSISELDRALYKHKDILTKLKQL